jgi:hypothetical protein
MLTFTHPEDPIYVSSADIEHHMRYLGRTGGFKNPDGSARVPTPTEVVELGWEPISYLDQFKTTV